MCFHQYVGTFIYTPIPVFNEESILMRKILLFILVLGFAGGLGAMNYVERSPSCGTCGNDSECPYDKVCDNGCCVPR